MKRSVASLILTILGAASASPAQTLPNFPPTPIAIHPAAEPDPALKYRLVPERRGLVPGNAAVFYHRAILMFKTREAQSRTEGDTASPAETTEQALSKWSYAPIGEIPVEEVRARLDPFANVLKEVELGAKRLDCDWEFDLRREGASLLISEIQETRSLARLVTVKARVAIRDGRTDEAMHWIEVGFVLGRHVAHGPTVIQGLVGLAINSVMANVLKDLIGASGTPSLYWALADRPRPFLDMRYPMEGERYILEDELPGLEELDRGIWSLDEARRFADEMQRKLYGFVAGEPIPGGGAAVPSGMPDLARRLGIAAMAARIYPEARRALIAEGRPEAEVEAMPVVQVATIYTYRAYRRRRDDMYKWMNLPYKISFDRFDWSDGATLDQKLANPMLAIFLAMMPALHQARLAALRLDRQLDALQCVEAIRLYAQAHGGELPESLEAIAEAPAPLDPITGHPFSYERKGDSATLSAPFPPGGPNHPTYAIHYLLTLVK